MKHIISAVTWLLIVMTASVAYAQNRAWADPYDKAQDAIKGRRYQEAINLLEAAIKANPKAEANKRIEGVYTTDYFPYYYLGIAYFETGNYRKAQENFEKAKSPAPRDKSMVARLADYQQKTQAALAAPAPSVPTASPAPSSPPAIARGPETEPARSPAGDSRSSGPSAAPSTPPAAPTSEAPRVAAVTPPPANIPSSSADARRPGDDRKAPEPPASSDMKNSLRTALRALFQGDVQASIALFEPMSRQKGSASDVATLHAYLGVAYATRALSSRTLDEAQRWNSTASEQFKLALASQANFQLSSRMVSPKIVTMFNQARR